MVRSLCPVHVLSVLLTEVPVYVLKVAEGQLRWVAMLAQSQVAYSFLYDIAGGRVGR